MQALNDTKAGSIGKSIVLFWIAAVRVMLAVLVIGYAGNVRAQAPPVARGANAAIPAYPVRPPGDPALIARGKGIFGVNCGFCHGNDARGGETGPNLIRSSVTLDDKNGELIGQVVREGRPLQGMPKFDLSDDDIKAVAEFIHSFPSGGHVNLGVLVDPVVGDAKAGEAFFNGAGKCVTCHSVSGDLSHLGAKYQPIPLQGAMLSGGRGGRGIGPANKKPVTVTVTLASGQKIEGSLDRLDDFDVSLTDSSGVYRDFSRDGDSPKIEVHDPLQPHLDMLKTLTDAQIHNLTAYLVTLK